MSTDSSGEEFATVEEMDRDDLEDEVRDLRDEVDDLRDDVRRAEALTRQFRSKIDTIEALLVGQDELFAYEPDEIAADPMHARLQGVEEDVQEHDEKLTMVELGEGTKDSPDGRARTLRQVCYNEAKQNDGLSRLTRDEASTALQGGLHRGSVIDAMKRAADGQDAETAEDYTPIQGASDLTAQEGLRFVSGEQFEQSYLEFDGGRLTSVAARENLTTGGGR
jgi:hypothetical protein